LQITVAVMIGLAMVVALYRTLRASVAAGESRREAVAALVDATWRCNAMDTRSEREECRARLAMARPSAVATQGQSRAAVLTIAQEVE